MSIGGNGMEVGTGEGGGSVGLGCGLSDCLRLGPGLFLLLGAHWDGNRGSKVLY